MAKKTYSAPPPPIKLQSATRGDSLNVYNNALEQKKFYDSKSDLYVTSKLSSIWNTPLEKMKKIEEKNLKALENKKYNSEKSKKITETIKAKSTPNTVNVLDMLTPNVDIDAPLATYDDRIQPQGTIKYLGKYLESDYKGLNPEEGKFVAEGFNKDLWDEVWDKAREKSLNPEQTTLEIHKMIDNFIERVPGANIEIPYYDPLAIKPFDLLSSEEKKTRVEKYGRNGVPNSYNIPPTAYKSQTVMYPDGSYELRQVPYYEGNDRGTWTQGTKLNPPGVINATDLSPEEISLLKNKNKLQPVPTTNQQFLDGGPLVDKTNHGKLLNSVYASAEGNYYANGGMLKRADGSYSQRGLWDNIRANKGSGKKPTKEMLAQEKKINKEYADGGYLGDNGNTQVHTDKAGNTTTKFTKPDGTTYIKVKNANGKVYNKTISGKDALQNELNTLQKKLKTYDSQNGGQGPTNMSDMFERADVFKKIVELEANNKNRLKSTPRIDQMEAVGNTMLTVGKYFMPLPLKTGVNYLLNASDAIDYTQDPNSESNKLSIASDILSPLKSTKTKMAPFSVISDVVNLQQQYDKFNNANNEVYNVQHANGGQFTRPYSLPEDNFMQGGNNLHNSVYASSMGQYPAPYEYGGPMSHFYASNVEEPATIGKDLAYNNGGTMNPIHINPENKGKFNATKARTGKTTEELTHSSNPLTRKRAIFAQNASRWNHQYGGYMFAEGGNLDPLTTFDEGGKHSENKLGGIPQGQNAQGGMNLVEEGETKLNSKDYIFSDTLKVDKDTVAEFNLPKTMVGKTFADASKKMNRPDSRRINDSIEKKAKERDLNALMEAQEVFKEKEVAKKMEEIQSLNPGLFEQMQEAQMQPQGQPQPSPEEMMMMQQGQPPMDPAMMEQMVAPQQQGVPQQYGGQMSYKCGGSMYDFGGKLGEGIKNYGLSMADTTMSYLGMDNVIKDDQYEGFGADAAKGYAKVVGGIGKKVLPMAANMIVPGSGAVISGAQQLGSMANPQQEQEQIAQMGGMNFKYGGTFDMPRQQMYMPLDHVTKMGGELSIEDQGLQNLENDYRNSIFEGGGFTAAQLAAQEAEPIMYPPDAMQYPQGLTYAQANSAIAPGLQDSEIEVAQKMLRDASTEEEHAKALEAYQSAVARHDESLKNRNVDLTMNQTPMQAIGSALPIGYNIGMGLFGKVQQLNASDYMQKADIKAPEMNINPQLRATDQSFAQASNAGRNAGAGSEYLAYMSNLNNMRNKGYADLYGQKFNVDSQNAMNAQLQNKAIEGQNLQTKMGIVDYNAKAKAAKTAMLQEGLKQAATLADNSKGMDAQLALMKAIAPDFAGDMKYNTIFDQYKNRTKKV